MPGETGGPTERPPRSRRERPVTRETVRPIDTREDVETAFYDSFGLLEHTDDSKLSPELQWAKKGIRSSIDKSLDRDSDTVTVDYNGEYTKFRQEEGIPVDHLIDFLNNKLSDSRYDTAERKNLQEKINILRRNSTPFYDVDLARSNPEQMVARIRYEAHLISQDSRATGTELGDWELAKKELNRRRELFVNPLSTAVTEVEAEEPAEVSTTETSSASTPSAPEPEPEFIGPPPPPEWAREILTVIGRRDEEIRNNALLDRYQKIREEMRRGSLWDPRTWTRKIGLRLGEDYFGAKYLAKAIKAKLESGNTKAQAAFEGSTVDADYKRAEEQEAGKLGIKRTREAKLFEGEKVTEATGELKKKIVDGLLKPIVDGTITDEKQLQAKIKEFVQANQDNAELKAIFGPEASKYGNWADYFASDLLEMGASVRETMTTHAKTLEELDSYIKIKLANLSWTAETGAPKVGAIDKLVMKMQGGSKRGLIWNPATLGATASLGTAVGLRALGTTAQASQFIVPGVGAVVGGGVAGLRRYHDMNVDRAAAQIEDTYSQSSEGNAPRRESLSQRDYDRAHVGELLNGGGKDLVTGEERESLASLLSKDLSEGQETNRQAAVRRIAEIEKRLDFSRKNSLDLVRYESEDKVQHGRLDLLEGTARAREALRIAGMTDEQIRETETRLKGEWEEKFIQNRDEQDWAFASYRLRNAAGSALFGGLAGLGAGALVQEGVAVTGRALGANFGETGLEWAGKRIAEVGRAGRAAAAELPKTNAAAASTIAQEIQGGSKPSSTVSEVLQAVVANKEVPVEQEWAKNATEIHERIWEKGNDQLLHTVKDGNKLGLDITRMSANVQRLVQGGELGFAFTTNNGQTVFISENSDMVKDGVLWLDPNSKNVKVAEFSRMILNQNELAKLPNGDIATEVHNRRGIFNVKYIEAADLVKDGNKNILHAFATIQGTGNMPATVEVPQTIETPKPITETPKPIQTPPGGTETPRPIQTPSPTETPRPITTAIPSASPSPTPTPGGGFDFGIPRRPGEEIPAPPLIPIPFSPRHPLEPIGEKPRRSGESEPEPTPLSPEDRKLEEMFTSLPSPVIEGHKYFVEKPPEDIRLTKEEMTSLESRVPFFVKEGDLIKAREEAVPFVWDPVVGIEKNPRFKEAEDLTQGDSGLLALAANSARTPQEQARLYRALSKSVIGIHENNPELLKEWYKAQDEFSINVFRGIDNQEIRKGDSSTILLATELNATSDQQIAYIESVWPDRIKSLKEAIANKKLEPHDLRWIEFLSHSVNIPELIKKAQEQPAETIIPVKTEVKPETSTTPTPRPTGGSTPLITTPASAPAPIGGTEATIPTETPLPKAKDLKFGPEFDAAREREALAAGWKKSPSGTWTSPDGKRTQSFAPFPEPTREPEPVAPPAEPAVIEAPVAPPAIEVGSELIQRDGGDKFTVVREDAEKVTLEKKREDGTLESRVTLGREDLEKKLETPGGAWSAPTAPATSEPVAEPGPAAPEVPATTEAVTPVIEPGMKIRSPRGRELEVVAADERDIVLRDVDGKEETIDRKGVELAIAQNEAAIIPAAEEIEETPPGMPRFDSQGKIIGFEKPEVEVELPPTHPAAEEPLETTEPDTLEELELRKELTKLLHGQADPNMPIAQVKERLAQLKPVRPVVIEPFAPEIDYSKEYIIPTDNPVKALRRIVDMKPEQIREIYRQKFGEEWEGTTTDLKFELGQRAVAAAYDREGRGTKAKPEPVAETPASEEPIEISKPVEEKVGFVPSGNFLTDVERVRAMSEEELIAEGKRRHGKDWQPTKFNQIDLQFELELEANAARTDLPRKEGQEETEPKKEEEKVERLDAIIVLGKNIGEEWDAKKIRERKYQLSPHSRLSVLAAGLLYKAGYTDRLIFSTGYTAGKGLTESGQPTLSEAQAMKNRLLRIFPDIPEDAIELEQESLDTLGNAQKVKEILKKHNYTNVGLLTVGFHIPRAKMLFGKEGIEAKTFASENVLKDRRSRFLENYLESELVQKEIKKEKTAKLIQSMPLGPQLLRMVVKLTRGERVSAKIKPEKSAESEAVKTEVTTETAEDKARKYYLAIEERKQKLAEEDEKKKKKTKPVKTEKDEAMRRANIELKKINERIEGEKKGKRNGNGRPKILENSQIRGKRFHDIKTAIKRNIDKRRKKK